MPGDCDELWASRTSCSLARKVEAFTEATELGAFASMQAAEIREPRAEQMRSIAWKRLQSLGDGLDDKCTKHSCRWLLHILQPEGCCLCVSQSYVTRS